MSQRSNELLILGNGPSLRDHDFDDFVGWPSLGMNAAYRFWRRIDWRPNFYCCLDDALIDTHKVAIHELIVEERIEKFFLTARILDHFPALVADQRVRFLDEFVPHWHRVRGHRFGLKFVQHKAFETGSPNMLTTGSYSIRFAAMLGYESVRLLGMDLTYHDLEESQNVGGTRLVIKSTPSANPNYFFDDYQQTGDQFNIANPVGHGRELHLHAFAAIRDDFIANSVPLKLSNANLQSKLFSEAVFPYRSIHTPVQMGTRAGISALLIRITDPKRFESLLWLWSQPAFFPILGVPDRPLPDLIIEAPDERSERIKHQVNVLDGAYPALRRCFGSVKLRAPDEQSRLTESDKETVFQIDDRTIPLHCDWLGQLMVPMSEFGGTLEVGARAKIEDVLEKRLSAPNYAFLRSDKILEKVALLMAENVSPTLRVVLSTRSIDETRYDSSGARHKRSLFSVGSWQKLWEASKKTFQGFVWW